MPDETRSDRPLRVAVHGIVVDNVGSSAGSFPLLLGGMLERGHRVELFANPGYIKPGSLEGCPGYRFHALRSESAERFHELTRPLGAYASSLSAQYSHIAYDRAAKRRIEELDRSEPYDVVLCADAQSFWPSRLPVISWPQSPPHTEAAALRDPAVARFVVKSRGAAYFAAVQAYYAYRQTLARAALPFTDLFMSASRWAIGEWVRFGAARERLQLMPYPFDLTAFAQAPPPGARPELTLLWLGRATPRKRLDLFLAAFSELRKRRPDARARLVGNLKSDPLAAPILAAHAGAPGVAIEDPVPRERIPELLAEVDVVVQPSQNENFGASIAEALAAGRPVVAGPTNGTFEYAGAAGFGFDEYTPPSIARAMERALDAVRARGGELAATAREAARTVECDRVIDDFCRVAREVAERRRPPA